MTANEVHALLPLMLVAGTAVVVLLMMAIRRSHAAAFALTLAGLAASFCLIFFVPTAQVTPLLDIDRYALFFFGLITAASIAVALLAYGYFGKTEGNKEELYVLLLVATLGAMVLAASSHFATLFLGLEVLSVGLYSLIGYLPNRPLPIEAAIKYLVLAGSSAAFMLFGIALVYAALGTMDFARIAQMVTARTDLNLTLLLPGVALVLTGIGFKLALVPFHMWTPDIYEGAPAPVSAFVATVSKGGMFALLLRYFHQSAFQHYGPLMVVLIIIAIASMLAGNLLALLQSNVKRILAYSSIAHMGYVLVALEVGGALGATAVIFYLIAYFVMTMGAFAVVTVLSPQDRDADRIEDYRGLFWRRPVLALVMTAMLLSLAGIPMTAGFIGKFYIIAAGASAGSWTLILILIIASTIGLFYYLRIVVALYQQPGEVGQAIHVRMPTAAVALTALTLILIWLGVYPSEMLKAIQSAVSSLL